VKRDDDTLAALSASASHRGEDIQILGGSGAVDHNLHTLLGTFSEVFLCASGKSCISKLSELNHASIVDLIPTLVLIDIPYKDQLQERPLREIRTPSPSSKQQIDSLEEDQPEVGIYGLSLLRWIASEIQYQSLSKLFVPVAVVAIPEQSGPTSAPRKRANSKSEISQLKYDVQDSCSIRQPGLVIPLDQVRTMRYLDVGAVDVLTSPLLHERLPSLAIHAYRAHKDASKDQRALLEMKRGRKRSWVGLDDQKPYAYLREAMVSGLMDGICKMGGNDNDEPYGHMRILIAADRRELIAAAIGSWHFSAHEFTDDELLHAALLMLQHALAMPELGKWRISTGES
jgi:3',5'-cyclic-nucleotide phosphodiesterase